MSAAPSDSLQAAELQKRMQSLMSEFGVKGGNSGSNGGGSKSGVSPKRVSPEDDTSSPNRNHFSALFPIPGVPSTSSHGTNLDQDLARLLPPEIVRGNSPVLDQEKWMQNMMGNLPGGGAAGAGSFHHQQGMFPRGGRGRGGPFPHPDFFPHGRHGGRGGFGFQAPFTPPHVPPAVPAPATAPVAPAGKTTAFKPNLAAKPFRPTTQIGAPIPPESAKLLQEAFSNFPLLQDVVNNKGQPTGLNVSVSHDSDSADAPLSDPEDGKNGKSSVRVQRPVRSKNYGFSNMPNNSGLRLDGGEDESMDARTPMAYVEFKRQKIKKFPSQGVIQPGQYVIVDGDRGQDCGLLVQMTAPTADGKLSVLAMEGSVLEDQKLKVENGRVIRVAEAHEVDMLHNEIAASEASALRQCRQRCQELGLTIEILDCEYQFDMKKVSFYFNSDKSVDFRDLVRDLYRSFGARIWMENINPNVKNVVPTGPLGKHLH